jgi:replication factor C subunit 2/4
MRCFAFDLSRPKNVGEVAHQEEVINTLTKALECANVSQRADLAPHVHAWAVTGSLDQLLLRFPTTMQLPHLLFYGPPGTGKTSTALAIARQLYG